VGENGKGRKGFYLDDVLAMERREGRSKFFRKAGFLSLLFYVEQFLFTLRSSIKWLICPMPAF